MATTASRFSDFLRLALMGRYPHSAEITAFETLQVATDGTQEANKFITTDSASNQGVAKVTELHIGSSSGTQVNATAAEINQHADVSARGLTLTTTKSVELTDNHKIFFLNLADGFTVTMPKLIEVEIGWSCTFLVTTAPTTSYIIKEDAADSSKVKTSTDIGIVLSTTDSPESTGHINYNFVGNQAAVGDWCRWETDKTNWFVYGVSNLLAGVTLT